MDTSQNMDAAMEKTTAIQSSAIIFEPRVSLTWYALRAVFNAPTRVEKRMVEVMAARKVKSVAVCDNLSVNSRG
jgi:hypothetical protein